MRFLGVGRAIFSVMRCVSGGFGVCYQLFLKKKALRRRRPPGVSQVVSWVILFSFCIEECGMCCLRGCGDEKQHGVAFPRIRSTASLSHFECDLL